MGQLIIKIDSNVNNYKFQVTVTSPRNLGANEKLPLFGKITEFYAHERCVSLQYSKRQNLRYLLGLNVIIYVFWSII